MTKANLIFALVGYGTLLYLFMLLPFYLYTPTRTFDLPHLLWLTHLILLYIHEAGHLIFSIFGRTVSILGGSLNQICIPLIWFVVAKREKSSLSNVALFFTGVSIVDVSVYIKDAGMLQLPLIGGLTSTHHDWANLLNEWGLIEESFLFGEIFFWCGIGIAVWGLFAGVRSAFNQFKTTSNRPISY